MTPKFAFLFALKCIAFAILIGVGGEYCVNRANDTFITLAFVIVAILAFYFLIYKSLKLKK